MKIVAVAAACAIYVEARLEMDRMDGVDREDHEEHLAFQREVHDRNQRNRSSTTAHAGPPSPVTAVQVARVGSMLPGQLSLAGTYKTQAAATPSQGSSFCSSDGGKNKTKRADAMGKMQLVRKLRTATVKLTGMAMIVASLFWNSWVMHLFRIDLNIRMRNEINFVVFAFFIVWSFLISRVPASPDWLFREACWGATMALGSLQFCNMTMPYWPSFVFEFFGHSVAFGLFSFVTSSKEAFIFMLLLSVSIMAFALGFRAF